MMRVKIKQNDELRNTTTTLTDDGELTIALDASTTYFVDAVITFTAGATPDIKYAWVYTGTITNALMYEGACDPTLLTSGGDSLGPAYCLGGANFTTPRVRTRVGSNTANTVGGAHIRGVILTNSSGDLKLQWAQVTSSGTGITVQKGSYLALAKQADMDGTLIIKAGDTSRTNNTLAADPDLVFTTVANQKYIAEIHTVAYSTSVTPDYKFALHDAQVSQAAGHVNNGSLQATEIFSPSTEVAIHGQFRQASFLTTPTGSGNVPTSTITDKNHTHVDWSHVMGGTPNTVAWEWAQNTTNATATVLVAPSWILYEEVFQ